jgi:hypothetical protein
MENTCAVTDCPKPRERREWCNAHYRRWLTKGDPEAGAPLRNLSPVPCSVDGCETNARVYGFCIKHHRRWEATGDPLGMKNGRDLPLIDRFMQRVNKDGPDGCWLWTAGKKRAYGAFAVEHDRTVLAHRWSYEHHVGPIPDGLTIDHLCRRPLCVNPAHLEPVTPRMNVLRGDTVPARNARKTHCKRGHPFDEVNTYINSRGHRVCRECTRAANRRYATARRSKR